MEREYFLIRAKHSGKVLTVQGQYNYSGSKVVQSTETRNDNQLFEFRSNPNGGNNYQIVSKANPAYSFTIKGVNAREGDVLGVTELDSYWKAKCQLFYLIPQANGFINIQVKYDYSDIKSADISKVKSFASQNKSTQDAIVADQESSKSRYINGLVLDVEGGSSADGATVRQWTFNGTDAQLFRLEKV